MDIEGRIFFHFGPLFRLLLPYLLKKWRSLARARELPVVRNYTMFLSASIQEAENCR